jgi:hypothetical protein
MSPAFTTGFAGAPMCIFIGMTTLAGAGIRTGSISAVFFLCGACTPPILKNGMILTSSLIKNSHL